jgi:hypothetical protein
MAAASSSVSYSYAQVLDHTAGARYSVLELSRAWLPLWVVASTVVTDAQAY